MRGLKTCEAAKPWKSVGRSREELEDWILEYGEDLAELLQERIKEGDADRLVEAIFGAVGKER